MYAYLLQLPVDTTVHNTGLLPVTFHHPLATLLRGHTVDKVQKKKEKKKNDVV